MEHGHMIELPPVPLPSLEVGLTPRGSKPQPSNHTAELSGGQPPPGARSGPVPPSALARCDPRGSGVTDSHLSLGEAQAVELVSQEPCGPVILRWTTSYWSAASHGPPLQGRHLSQSPGHLCHQQDFLCTQRLRALSCRRRSGPWSPRPRSGLQPRAWRGEPKVTWPCGSHRVTGLPSQRCGLHTWALRPER